MIELKAEKSLIRNQKLSDFIVYLYNENGTHKLASYLGYCWKSASYYGIVIF